MHNKMLKMNLQTFAEPAGDPPAGEPTGGQQNQAPQFDYEKLAGLISGKQSVTEETVLKNYFKQQGLNQEEARQAIETFKQQKAANTPDVTALQTQLTQAQSAVQKAQLEAAATMAAVALGIDAKTIPYIMKMADMSKAMDKDGKISEEEVKNALNKVLEDVPALKPQMQQNGGVKFGASGQGQQTTANEDALKQAFGL